MWSLLLAWLQGTESETRGLLVDEGVCEGPSGSELFQRTWVEGDARAQQGDGLGPTYNARSCVACHQQGGAGGAGGAHTNVRLRSIRGRTHVVHRHAPLIGPRIPPLGMLGALGMLGEEFGERRFDTTSWAGGPRRIQQPVLFEPRDAERNTPALWGTGLVDAIAADALWDAALPDPLHHEITGRVSRDERGRVSRFGWKGQTATLALFVEQACVGELGLETSALHQPGQNAPGPDLEDSEFTALVSHVASLPRPVERPSKASERGRELFEEVGCAGCHRPELGLVQGLYSDLLLHDLGRALAEQSLGYEGLETIVPDHDSAATASEWRTPPLWGLRDSAPYLHDGRAETPEEAIELHGGEATRTRRAYLALALEDKLDLVQFLSSLTAP